MKKLLVFIIAFISLDSFSCPATTRDEKLEENIAIKMESKNVFAVSVPFQEEISLWLIYGKELNDNPMEIIESYKVDTRQHQDLLFGRIINNPPKGTSAYIEARWSPLSGIGCDYFGRRKIENDA